MYGILYDSKDNVVKIPLCEECDQPKNPLIGLDSFTWICTTCSSKHEFKINPLDVKIKCTKQLYKAYDSFNRHQKWKLKQALKAIKKCYVNIQEEK